MNQLFEIFIILIIAIVIASIFYYGFKTKRPWGPFWIFLLLLFFASWAGRLWLYPVGPVFWGVAWLPVIIFVLVVALAMGVAAASDDKVVDYEPETKTKITKSDKDTARAFGIFFWFLILIFAGAIIAGLFFR